MWASYLADLVVISHFAWIFYVLIGQILILLGILLSWSWIRNFWFRFTHITMMLLVAAETLFQIDCPLTVWEKRLRGFTAHQAIQYSENDSFIARQLGNIIFIDGLDGGAWQFVVGYLAFTLLVVWSFWKSPPRMPMPIFRFIAWVHLVIGTILLATTWSQWGVGLFFLVEGLVWYGLGGRRDEHQAT